MAVRIDAEAASARLRDMERALDEFAADWKFIPTLPRGANGEKAILLLDYMIPDLQHIVATHFISRGWRRHDDLALTKPRKVVGGLFEDLVVYVPTDQPDTPIVIPQNTEPDPNPALWSVTPTVHDIFEERPTDD